MDKQEIAIFVQENKPRLEFLYGDKAKKSAKRLEMLVERYGLGLVPDGDNGRWSEKDAIVISYGDTIKKQGEYPLHTLQNFMDEYVGDSVSGLHILPFFPYSSDDGFSVINYRQVREDLGGWYHIKQLGRHYRIMADLVINHVSRKSSWFKDYQQDVAPASEYFIEMDPDENLSKVTRPRSSPLLTEIKKGEETRHVWTTFSADQIDVDFSNPDVLFEYLDIILFYISQGVSVIRLDAIAYLWKKKGTNCIHLPETHEVVRLIRSLLNTVAPHVTLITETNVPHKENVSYFGNGDEAHMVYQFSLPPLLLYTLLFGDASYLTNWAQNLESPPEGCTYFNFTASHDGVGVRPIEGLVPQDKFDALVQAVRDRGGMVSMKANADGSESPYELNVSYFDAMKDAPDADESHQVQRFLSSQAIMLSLQGVPGIYIHSLTATPNDLEGVKEKGHNRAINRKSWELMELTERMESEDSDTRRVFTAYKNMLDIRKKNPAFHPEGAQEVFDAGTGLFAVQRTAPDGSQKVLSITNVTAEKTLVDLTESALPLASDSTHQNLLTKDGEPEEGNLTFAPYETKWLVV
ncbi:sugar phosphorylase [Gracilimonas mengyeensis]|uniref:Sucrose phosphorylase n=1 Tax=Gracilimonas mengyeensis TaxID=1302730 RepID=A0A521CI99_9BACT|nr:sugar phosphorylase [Gracilimonas mengyeensis]SMO59176.1 sucrose phosphorylase [Gracilimonas mengyeensis]